MRRREFITLLGGAAAWPLAARAQQTGKLPTIGFLGPGHAFVPRAHGCRLCATTARTRLDRGSHLAIEYRWAEGRNERFAEIAAEFVRLKVDVIVTTGPAVPAVKQATSVIPIVFAIAKDPVGSGLVASLSRPGGNVTGLSIQQTDLPASGSNFCARLFPVSAAWRSWPMSAIPTACWRWARFRQRPARSASKSPHSKSGERRISRPPLRRSRAARTHFMLSVDPLMNTNRMRINTLALGARLPTIYGIREFVEAGGLMSYGPNFPDLFRRAADYVDKILRGAKPADIPVEQPTKFDLVVNLTTAKALGLNVPSRSCCAPTRSSSSWVCFQAVHLAAPAHVGKWHRVWGVRMSAFTDDC